MDSKFLETGKGFEIANSVGIEATELKLIYKLNNQNYQIGWVPEVLKPNTTGVRSCTYSTMFLVKHNVLTGTYDLTPFYYIQSERGYMPADIHSLNCQAVQHFQNLTESVYLVQLVDKCDKGKWRSLDRVQFSLYLPANVSVHKGTSTTYDTFEVRLCKVSRMANTEILYKQFKLTSLNAIVLGYRRRIEAMMAYSEWSVKHRTLAGETAMEKYARFCEDYEQKKK